MVVVPASLAEFSQILGSLPGPDKTARAAAEAREPQLTKPAGSLGRLEELAHWLAAWQGRHPPRVERAHCLVFAGNHGVASRGASAFPPEVTVQMVANFRAGGAAINQLCRASGVDFEVIELELDRPTADFTQGPAMSEEECVRAIVTGMQAVPDDIDLLTLGEMGIANTAAAAAVCLGLYGGTASDWTGPGTGLSGAALDRKTELVAAGAEANKALLGDPLQALRCLGGRELAAIAGAVVAARLKRVPVLLDGFICCAAAAPLASVAPHALDHCRVAHGSAEPGHRRLVARLGGPAPLLDLGMRLGEASGATLAVPLCRAAAACHGGMATFAEAAVSESPPVA
ncbi:nicotinate-nucleotide--dimethylbenzimidazole phosphoribosyltransferase [Roseospirillum parvum]|uniref:Nicotinate-nucleotide--dimethylbenzimidazole phosphoribosyltransferase n=1 Tax=Roseospirillum parvum TaxID=83401 RepID=A0A1G8DHA8_9PROT|nr:nicotinate-nucleotide--dimethylbenzimidazole phosphoribosyltransferase [Roseospirillum parvum]SDH56700.1 nicotinate-nucleotide--dimethylbenzimidazole phosphoribosyltransferase [Roseospirillum parvum]